MFGGICTHKGAFPWCFACTCSVVAVGPVNTPTAVKGTLRRDAASTFSSLCAPRQE